MHDVTAARAAGITGCFRYFDLVEVLLDDGYLGLGRDRTCSDRAARTRTALDGKGVLPSRLLGVRAVPAQAEGHGPRRTPPAVPAPFTAENAVTPLRRAHRLGITHARILPFALVCTLVGHATGAVPPLLAERAGTDRLVDAPVPRWGMARRQRRCPGLPDAPAAVRVAAATVLLGRLPGPCLSHPPAEAPHHRPRRGGHPTPPTSRTPRWRPASRPVPVPGVRSGYPARRPAAPGPAVLLGPVPHPGLAPTPARHPRAATPSRHGRAPWAPRVTASRHGPATS